MTKFIGKKDTFTAIIGAFDHNLRNVCLEHVTSESGFYKDHMWVNYTKRLSFNRKTKIRFTAMVTEYTGLNKKTCEQVKKVGLMTLRNVKRKEV